MKQPAPPAPGGPLSLAVAPRQFLDVTALLESSLPRPRVSQWWYLLAGFLGVGVLSAVTGTRTPGLDQAVRMAAAFLMLAFMGGLSVLTVVLVRRFRAEQGTIEAAGEMVQLRRWPEAAAALEHYLSRPARTLALRTQALVYLASVLARYHRYEDAIAVYDYLLELDVVDPPGAYGLRLGRAMALLAEDHLLDADRAISNLRRLTGDKESAGLALVELYRDVKTGHPAEAVELFDRRLPALRDGLGHRVGDAYALVARAYDLLGRTGEAQAAFAKATLLAPPPELFRRYPEVRKLEGRYAPTVAPPEAA